MPNRIAWPRGLKKPKPHTRLDGSIGAILAPLIASAVRLVARESMAGAAMVAVDDDRHLLIEPADARGTQWILEHSTRWVVGTYYANAIDQERIEGDLCARLSELERPRRTA